MATPAGIIGTAANNLTGQTPPPPADPVQTTGVAQTTPVYPGGSATYKEPQATATTTPTNTTTTPDPKNPYALPAGNVDAGSSAAPTTDAKAPTAQPTTNVKQANYGDVAKWNVDDKSSVANNLQGIIASNSPLMQQAQTKALEAMNGRGLVNSSMAEQAGQAAVIQSALPIAQQDASTNASAGQFNAAAENQKIGAKFSADTQGNMQDASASNQSKAQQYAGDLSTNQQNAQAKNQASMQQYDAGLKAAMQNADAATKLQLSKLDSDTKTNLANIQANYQVLMQANSSGAQLYSQALQQMSAIMNDKDLDATSKTAYIKQLTDNLQASLGYIGKISNLDLAGITGTGGTIDTANNGGGTTPGGAPPPPGGSGSPATGAPPDAQATDPTAANYYASGADLTSAGYMQAKNGQWFNPTTKVTYSGGPIRTKGYF